MTTACFRDDESCSILFSGQIRLAIQPWRLATAIGDCLLIAAANLAGFALDQSIRRPGGSLFTKRSGRPDVASDG